MKATYQSLRPDWLEASRWDGQIPPPPYLMTMHVAGRHHAGKWRFKQDSEISLGQDAMTKPRSLSPYASP